MAQPGEQDLGLLLEALQALQVKRQPLVERLRAIEEKKSATAPHIYEKFRRETIERLQVLEEEARGHRAQALLARDVVSERRADVDRESARLSEELEEVRFRNTLGEFTAEDFQQAEAAKLGEIEQVSAMTGPLLELARLLDSMLESAPEPAPPSVKPVPPAPAVAAPPAGPFAAHSPAPAPSFPPPAPAASSASEFTRPHPLPPLPGLAPQPVAAQPARSPASEMEALFGSAPVAAPPRPVAVPSPPSRSEPLPPFPGAVADAPPPRPVAVPLAPEETTQDLGIRASRGHSGFPEQAVGAAARPVLIVKTKDKDRGEDTYDLGAGQTLIGRAPENDIILLEESVSRRHARIMVEGPDCSIEDLGSANGSYVNGEKLRPKQPRKLQDNDVVKMGQLLALFRLNPED